MYCLPFEKFATVCKLSDDENCRGGYIGTYVTDYILMLHLHDMIVSTCSLIQSVMFFRFTSERMYTSRSKLLSEEIYRVLSTSYGSRYLVMQLDYNLECMLGNPLPSQPREPLWACRHLCEPSQNLLRKRCSAHDLRGKAKGIKTHLRPQSALPARISHEIHPRRLQRRRGSSYCETRKNTVAFF